MPAAKSPDLHPALDKRKTILIADDSELVRKKIRQALERDTDFEVCGEVSNGSEAVGKARELAPDLIILDVRMPCLSGIDVAGVLRYALPKTRRVLLTMYAEDVGPNLVSQFQIDAVLAKADGLADLGAQVKRLLSDPIDEVAPVDEAAPVNQVAAPQETMEAV
ncbi:MAG: response regulator transcription factor [Terriglobales bacterium]